MIKQILLTALLIVAGLSCYSQIVFEEGYFIDETGHRINCLIRNVDWKNNPDGFEYKLYENTEIKRTGIQDAKEFGIDSISKYVRASVQIDRSSDRISYLDDKREPVFHEEQLFLKVLIEGKASLYMYEDEGVKRFFYKMDDSEIKQLVYKRYVLNDGRIIENNKFRQQVFVDLRCLDIEKRYVESLSYKERDLIRLFIKYNECVYSDYVGYELKEQRDLFNIALRPGLNISSMSLDNFISDSKDADFDNEYNFRFGIEAEFILPFNKNKWSLIAEPTYNYFKSVKRKEVDNVYGGFIKAKVDYKSLELPLGLRYYFFLKDGSKIYADIFYVADFSYNSTIEYTRDDDSSLSIINIYSINNIATGLGYKFKDRYMVELRYHSARNVLSDYLFYDSRYNTISLIFGYSLF